MVASKVTVYGAYWCPDCRRAKKFLGEQFIPYRWVDIEQDKEGEAYVLQKNDGKRIIPTIVFEDDSFLVEPSNAELAGKLGLVTEAKKTYYDLSIIGQLPNTAFLNGRAELDQYGFVLTGHDIAHGKGIMGMEPLPFESSIPGIFIAGDVRHGSTKQVASAVGEARQHPFRSESSCGGVSRLIAQAAVTSTLPLVAVQASAAITDK